MSKPVVSLLLDIQHACQRILSYTDGLSFDVFEQDDICYSAVIRQLEIIGEAANRIPKTFHIEHADIPW